MALENIRPAIDREISIKENLEFILNHLPGPLFPRSIMTKALGYQKEVFDVGEVLTYFKSSNYQDCRINAYPSFTDYHRINFTAPSFIMIDLDLKDFESQEKLDKTLQKILNKISKMFRGAQPTVLWTGGGYHIYQPISGFVLEEIDRFACYIDQNKKDLTSRFMQFAEDYFTDNRGDLQHRPSIKSCLIRIPGTINSKYNQEVRIIQKWDGYKPPIQYLLRDYRTWLVSGKINDKKQTKLEEKKSWKITSSKNIGYNKTGSIPWIEKLLQTAISDHRKYVIWRILVPYLFNVRNLPNDEVASILKSWLDSCSAVRPLDFNSLYSIRQNVRRRDRNHYLPININKLTSENYELYNIILGISK